MNPSLIGPAAIAISLMVCDATAATRYVATRIPTQPGYNTSAAAINASGAIAGNITRSVDRYGDEDEVAAITFSPNNELKQIAVPGSTAHAKGINNRGEIVGSYRSSRGARAFRFADGLAVDVSPLGHAADEATAINDEGDVAGIDSAHAFLIRAGHADELKVESYATAINAFGQIAGFFKSSQSGSSGIYHSFRFLDGVMEDLGALGETSYAAGINASGDVVGQTILAGQNPYPFLYTDGAMRYLGAMHGRAWAINSAGDHRRPSIRIGLLPSFHLRQRSNRKPR